jgi:hypothetical protein
VIFFSILRLHVHILVSCPDIVGSNGLWFMIVMHAG